MRDGSVVQIGTPRDIYENPTSMFASRFIGESNLLLGTVHACAGGIVTITVGGHRLRVADSRDLAQGTSSALSIRPERITTAPSDTAHESVNRLPGTVVERIFLGNRVRLRVACAETMLWVEEPPSAASDRLEENDAAEITWSLEDGRLILPADAGDATPA